MPANTIDEVLSELQTIIRDSERTGDRAGYFAALYYKVTASVKEGIAKDEFENGPRMEKLDVLFANRYLTAFDQWKRGLSLTESWKVAFTATAKSSYLVLQHLLLGMNAHINLDLGIAAVEVAAMQDAALPGMVSVPTSPASVSSLPTGQAGAIPDASLQAIHRDFDAINAIIGSLTYEVIHDISRISPLLSLLGLHAGNTGSLLIQFSIDNARDGAWCFAEELSQKSGDGYTACLTSRDQDIAKLAGALITSKGFIRLTLWIVHLFEWKKPGKIIGLLNNYKKTFIKANTIR